MIIPWTSESVDISSLTDNPAFKVRFHASGTDSGSLNEWEIDNVAVISSDNIYGANPCVTAYNFYLNGTMIGTSPDTSYTIPPGLVTFGQSYSACVSAVYASGVSSQVCTTITAQYLYPVTGFTADSVAGSAQLSWNKPLAQGVPPAGLTGYAIYRNGNFIHQAPHPDSLSYSDNGLIPGFYLYDVRAAYDLASYGFPGESGESLSPGAVLVTIGAVVVPAIQVIGEIVVSGGQSDCYHAKQVITVAGGGTTFGVHAGGEATLIAGEKISLLNGVSVAAGGILNAYITTDGLYCNGHPPLAPEVIGQEGLQEHAAGSVFRIFPNPATEMFTVRPSEMLKGEWVTMTLYNLTGEKVLEQNWLMTGDRVVSVSGFAQGIYLLKFAVNSRSEMIKLVKF
jgi:hypothetical protein